MPTIGPPAQPSLTQRDEEAAVRAARFDMVVRWAIYGGQVAASTALFHPFACARVLMDLGYDPVAPTLSRTLFGKPCLVLPNITFYVRFMRNRDGRGALWRGFGANFCGVLVGNLTNDIAYHLVDEFIKRKVRSSRGKRGASLWWLIKRTPVIRLPISRKT
ncbi:hypothetical protein BV898_16454 [Hypsibius exemplaris]|uniref:Uncharacterized protein n=1 Tax=Hypsibius exemplaris TaxID=2072580 RepID=A0A9X6NFX7_HYPEX|nr:hypothetical protein BV898_16454 [Hypsibius exemplaris]